MPGARLRPVVEIVAPSSRPGLALRSSEPRAPLGRVARTASCWALDLRCSCQLPEEGC